MEQFYYDVEIEHIIEILKDSLYFAVLKNEDLKVLKSTYDVYYFKIDDELVYTNYYFDFGPLDISCLYKYCFKLNSYLQYSQGKKRIVHYTSSDPKKRVNAAYLIGCYSVIYLKMEPKEIYEILLKCGGQFKSYVDASQGYSQFTIQILDCFNAMLKVTTCNFINFCDFNVSQYDYCDKLQNGDMNWVLPRKFLAFIGPTDNGSINGHSPNFYIKYFLDNDIKTVIRLNNKLYDSSIFSNVGIEHHDLFFPDGSVPTKQILVQFLELTETARAAIAVHCKAGLGRTGSLIGAYIIKHYHMTAREAIAWLRICRPGSVIGQQQNWLEKIENWLWRQGYQYRLQHFGNGDKIPRHKYGIYSKEWSKEKDKFLRHVFRRQLKEHNHYIQGHIKSEKLYKTYDYISPMDYMVHKCLLPNSLVTKPSIFQDQQYQKDFKRSIPFRNSVEIKNLSNSMLPKNKQIRGNIKKQNIDSYNNQNQIITSNEFLDNRTLSKLETSNKIHDSKTCQRKFKKQKETDQVSENKGNPKKIKKIIEYSKKTREDILNKITIKNQINLNNLDDFQHRKTTMHDLEACTSKKNHFKQYPSS